MVNKIRSFFRICMIWMRIWKPAPPPILGFDPDQVQVYENTWRLVQTNKRQLTEDYEKENGNILDADRAKELFPDFTQSNASRLRFLTAVYEPAQQLIDDIYCQKLRWKNAKGKMVIFTAGGPASGKSSLINSIENIIQEALIVMDGTLSDRHRAVKNIEKALAAKCPVIIYFVYRRFDEAVCGAIERTLSPTSFRPVPVRIVAGKYFGAMHTISALYQEFRENSNVTIEFRRFHSIGEKLEVIAIGDIIRFMPKKLAALEEEAYALLDERYLNAKNSGKSFPDEIYQQLKSKAPSFRPPR